MLAANSSDMAAASHNSPSFEFVPDSFKDLSDSLTLKEGNRGKGISEALSFQNAKLIRKTQCIVVNDFFNPSHRRAIRLSIRKSLKEVESPATEAKSGSKKGELSILKEAKAIFEVSQVLGVSFIGENRQF
ncbi:hypothetical protein V6N11_009621 [Hibiscus sabdariffa]|uniref:Uncharacterized protein n=2 Tax=Hibiscus sabdariffa TaxID=183260 RepID=A0ABR2P6H1_9ROSI